MDVEVVKIGHFSGFNKRVAALRGPSFEISLDIATPDELHVLRWGFDFTTNIGTPQSVDI